MLVPDNPTKVKIVTLGCAKNDVDSEEIAGVLSQAGYSVAGEETVVQIPELNVCFDIGRAPYFALTSDFVCIMVGWYS